MNEGTTNYDPIEECRARVKEAVERFDIETVTLLKYLEDAEMKTLHGVRFNRMIKAMNTARGILTEYLAGNIGELASEEEIAKIISIKWYQHKYGSVNKVTHELAKALLNKIPRRGVE